MWKASSTLENRLMISITLPFLHSHYFFYIVLYYVHVDISLKHLQIFILLNT